METATEMETATGTEMETETEMETGTEMETVMEMEMETETEMETATATETVMEMETEMETVMEMETETETEMETATGMGMVMETETAMETRTEMETETGTEMETETAMETATEMEAENPYVNVDEMHFTNIIFNLMDNAVKYRRDDVALHLDVATWNQGNMLCLSVQDNGIGIQKENLKRIFEKFYRVHTGNQHNVKGFGLGLAYVKTMVELHHGTIKATSEIGQGTKFILTLPTINN